MRFSFISIISSFAEDIKLAIPGNGDSVEFKALPAQLKTVCPDFTFQIVAAESDQQAVDLVLDGQADISEADAAGVIGRYRGSAHIPIHGTVYIWLWGV